MHIDQSKPKPSALDTFTSREFEWYLRRLGASRSQAMKATHALPTHTMLATLPTWRRLRIAWRARHVRG